MVHFHQLAKKTPLMCDITCSTSLGIVLEAAELSCRQKNIQQLVAQPSFTDIVPDVHPKMKALQVTGQSL